MLPAGAGLSEDVFPRTTLAKIFSLDTKRWLDGSFMNPNALFELFGVYSGETGMQVRKLMLKYLGITKKCGAEDSNILKNAWIALHMQNKTAREWADDMFNRENPGDEIALYVLCKMYRRHCVVITSSKCWTTLEIDVSLPESILYDLCDIKLLYIEPGVFGELKLKPAMPPPPTNTVMTESATATVEGFNAEDIVPTEPINLSGNCITNVTGNNDGETRFPETINNAGDPYIDAPLSGSLECVATGIVIDNLLATFLVQNCPNASASNVFNTYNNVPETGTEKPDSTSISQVEQDSASGDNNGLNGVPEFPEFSQNKLKNTRDGQSVVNGINNKNVLSEVPHTSTSTSKNQLDMRCVVDLPLLSNTDLEAWLKSTDVSAEDGYNLRQRPASVGPVLEKLDRFIRDAKRNVSYIYSSESSHDESDISVHPGRWSKLRSRNIHVPSSGPSKDQMAAQRSIQKQKENVAAQALLRLYHSEGVTGDNTTQNKLDHVDVTPVNQTVTDSQDDPVDSEYSDSDDLSLSELKSRIKTDGKPFFKTKSYELFKYKCKHTFKCVKCEHTENSERKLRDHYRKNHGLLQCKDCDKLFNTISALRKHSYEHSEKAGSKPCPDCNKTFPFDSMLKSHRRVHLTVPEFHCLHCVKSFKNKGELTKHQNVHSKKKWKCQAPGCAYECLDPRNLKAHSFTHGNKMRYVCPKCQTGFNHYMQIKRHRNQDCKPASH